MKWMPALRSPDGEPYINFNNNLGFSEYKRFHRDFKEAGVKVYSAILDLGWTDVDTYDYTVTDMILDNVFEADPDGYFLPRIKLDAPVGWCRKYPEEVFVYGYGKGLSLEDIKERIETPEQKYWHVKVPEWYERAEEFKTPTTRVLDVQSISSRQWLRDGAQALINLINHLEHSKYADRIAGYHLAFGHCGETMHWRTEDYKNHGDYGIASLRNFYDFGIKRYENDENLKKAWGQPSLSRDNVDLPSAEYRYGGGNTLEEYFRGSDKDVICRDYDLFLADSVANAVEHFAKTAKSIVDKPVGYFYGYFLFTADVQCEGHLAFERIMKCPNVDFLASPTAYHKRGPSEPSFDMTVTQSVNRKKLFLEEIDTRTYIVPTEKRGIKPADCTNSFEETRYVLWRSLCKNLSYGSGFWWMDIGSGWFDSPDIMDEIGKLTSAHKLLKNGSHRSVADVLIVVDDESIVNTRFNRLFTHSFIRNLITTARSSGVLTDLYHVSDLDEIDLSRYKLLVFAINYTLTPERLASFNIPKDATVMFNNTVGIVKNGKPDLKNVEELTGFSLREDYDEELKCPVIKIVGEDNELTATKTVDGRRVVMNADPRITPTTFRQIAKEAGCHVYVDNDIVLYGDEDMLGVFSKGKTHSALKLTCSRRAKDIITGAEFDGDTIPIHLEENEFMVLRFDPRP